MTDKQFGSVNDFHDAELAVINHVRTWIPAYLAGRERKAGIAAGSIARPRSWYTAQTFTTIPGYESTPAIIVVSNGFTQRPRRKGDGGYEAFLRMAMAALTHGPEAAPTRALAGHYQAALVDLIINQRKITNTAARFHEWLDLRIEDLDVTQARTLAVARLEFIFSFDDFAKETGGFKTPPPDPIPPQPDLPEVHTVDTQVVKP